MAERNMRREMPNLWEWVDLKGNLLLKAFNYYKVKSNTTFHDIVLEICDYYALSAWGSLKVTAVENDGKKWSRRKNKQ